MQPEAARASQGCQNVAGTISASFTSSTTVAGTVTGGLAGTVSAVIVDIAQGGEGALHVTLTHAFTTGGGDQLFTQDVAVLSPIRPPLYRMDTVYTIVGGTGAFTGASGKLHNHGEVDLSAGTVSLRYHGRVCVP
jgi:hypothetical protein